MKKNLQVLLVVALAAIGLYVMAADKGGPFISGTEAKALVSKNHALLLDVRTAGEFSSGHIEGATNIPVQELEARLSTLPAKKDQDIVVYCRSGHRSAMAKELLEKAGFTKVHNLGPMTNWND
jgi:rhodanese-related sulfurtransferase